MGASFKGEACGSASGTAPRAHLAFYLIDGGADYVKAIDQAIQDGVDVLSLSLQYGGSRPFYSNSINIGTLSATKRGIFVSNSVGNAGPRSESIEDHTPWTLSVGASTTDRVTRVEIRLGNGNVILGETLNTKIEFFPSGASLPAVLLGPSDGVHGCGESDFSGVDVWGKAVVCREGKFRTPNIDPTPRGCQAVVLGARAMIMLNDRKHGSTVMLTLNCRIPTVHVYYRDGERLKTYLSSDPYPTLSFEPMGTITGVHRHPAVAEFSSRGPSRVNNMVLKPDILGPGVNILAAFPWTPSSFYYLSGTSMACPHLSGIAAMLRSLHPTWSPAMIKSAIMTTSDWQDYAGMPLSDETGTPANLFATGAGQVNGTRAADPGLVYDIKYRDYVKYICGLGYTPKRVETVLREPVDCAVIGGISGEELNYPTFYVKASPTPKVITRTVTNVGRPKERYTLSLDEPPGVMVDVFPRTLELTKLRQNLTYTVTVTTFNVDPRLRRSEKSEGQLTWVSAHHRVRSPMAIALDVTVD